MKIAIIVSPNASHQVETAQALVKGLELHGDSAEILPSHQGLPPRSVDAVCTWGWRRGMEYRNLGYEVLIMERAYISNRFKWVSLGWNGLNGRAVFTSNDDPSRWNKHFTHLMKPWRIGTGYALILGQVPTDMSCRHIDIRNFFGNVASDMYRHGWKEVRFRPHPQAPFMRLGAAQTHATRSLDEDLDGASMAITFNSNSGVDAVIRGVPTAAYDEGSMAWDVTSRAHSECVTPDREKWAYNLAWKQWLPNEIADGSAWAIVRDAKPEYRL